MQEASLFFYLLLLMPVSDGCCQFALKASEQPLHHPVISSHRKQD